MSDFQIEKVLALSTAHVRRETAGEIAGGAEWAPSWSRDEGWMFHVDTLLEGEAPADLRAAAALAREQGCVWLMLDMDGPIVDELEEHAW
jgi:hypothetical protein